SGAQHQASMGGFECVGDGSLTVVLMCAFLTLLGLLCDYGRPLLWLSKKRKDAIETANIY
ncbi:hypothetical protein, partial [Pseudomonas sp. GW704-F3]